MSCIVVVAGSELQAQRAVQRAVQRAAAQTSLDLWLVTRLRNAQLLPDSGRLSQTAHVLSARPRVESVASGSGLDSLFLVQYGPTADLPVQAVGSVAHLASPTGAVSMIRAEVIARRSFRAPRLPDAVTPREFRYGWAYVAVVRRHPSMPVTALRGWVLVHVADSSRTR